MKPKILVKKYGNRRLYDTVNNQYITLDELAQLIREGFEIQIVDSKTEADLTPMILTQIILENCKEQQHYLFSSQMLHQMIQYQDQSMSEFFHRYLPNILEAYVQWQQDAQQHFMNWARWGWSFNPYSQESLMPNFNFWGNNGPSASPSKSNMPESPATATEADEIHTLKERIVELENRLKKPEKRG